MSTVRMQGRRRLGELARVCGATTHPQTVAGRKKTPRTGRGGVADRALPPLCRAAIVPDAGLSIGGNAQGCLELTDGDDGDCVISQRPLGGVG